MESKTVSLIVFYLLPMPSGLIKFSAPKEKTLLKSLKKNQQTHRQHKQGKQHTKNL